MKASDFKQAAREARDRHARGDGTDEDLRILKRAEREGIDLGAPDTDEDQEVSSWDGGSSAVSSESTPNRGEQSEPGRRSRARTTASGSKQEPSAGSTVQQATTSGPETPAGRAHADTGKADSAK